MSDHSKREYNLRQLLEDNFIVSRLLRKVGEAISDSSLESYFISLANKRNQFAAELIDDIAFYGGKKPFFPPHAYDRRWSKLGSADTSKTIKKFYKLHNKSLEKYKAALSQINDGNCREVLIRHKAFVENTLFELKSLKTLLKYSKEQRGAAKENFYETS
ncbi:MAG: hypothetical protein WBL27_10995 [Salinimicrobium sp.]